MGHSWQQPLYTHPPSHPGACFGSPQEGWVPILLLLLSPTVIVHTHPSNSEQPYPSCSGTHTKIKPQLPQNISPRMPSLSSVTTIDPYSIHIDGIAQLFKKNKKTNYFARSMNESIRYQLPPYHQNLVEIWLIRLPMTPRSSVSSKDGSNVEGCSATSSEDDCNMVFTWVLDLVPYG